MTVMVELSQEEHYLVFLALRLLEVAYLDIRQETEMTLPSADRPLRSTVDDVLIQIDALKARVTRDTSRQAAVL